MRGEWYQRIGVDVTVAEDRLLAVETYVVAPAYRSRLSNESWDFKEFKEKHLKAVIIRYQCASVCPHRGPRMPYNEEIDTRIRTIISRWKNTHSKKMFGGVCHLLNGNMFCAFHKDFLIL
jgi:hypothetical protein